MKDRNYIEKVLLGKLINNKKEYYNNHSLLSSDVFKNLEHKKLYVILDKLRYQNFRLGKMEEFLLSQQQYYYSNNS